MAFQAPETRGGRESPVTFAPNRDSEEWLRQWRSVLAKDLIDSAVIAVDADTTVEDACEAILSNQSSCLAIKSNQPSPSPYLGLFDYADVNAFLKLAATLHTIHPDDLQYEPRVQQIVNAAKAGKVPVHLVSNLSEKNPLQSLPETSTIVELLEVFSRGAHRILIQSSTPSSFLGMVTDRALLAHFHAHAQRSAALHRFLSNPLHSLALPSLNLRAAVVCCTCGDTVLDAMKRMSDEGVSSVAVIDDTGAAGGAGSGVLLSAVSVTDIGKIVVPSQSKQVLNTPLHQFISQIKETDGSTDGVDKYPVYSVSAANTLRYTIEKILATTSHRVFVTEDSIAPSSPTQTSAPVPISPRSGNLYLRGVVSVVDVLSLFARLANLDVDPTRMQRQRRMSSASTSSKSSKSNRS